MYNEFNTDSTMNHTRNAYGDVMDVSPSFSEEELKHARREQYGRWGLMGLGALSLGLVVTAIAVGVAGGNDKQTNANTRNEQYNRNIPQHQKYVHPTPTKHNNFGSHDHNANYDWSRYYNNHNTIHPAINSTTQTELEQGKQFNTVKRRIDGQRQRHDEVMKSIFNGY